MESGTITTPFGRRTMSFANLANQFASNEVKSTKTVDKWKLYRSLCEARPLLGLTDRALALLNALLSFYPKSELSDHHGLVVFPSNAQLSLRAHGMSEQTIRRHLAVLVEAGLLIRKDSPNGKRYAHKNRAGDIRDAFGFSLAPLLARADEIEELATRVEAERVYLQRLRERLTLYRRDITKLVETARIEGLVGDWDDIISNLRELLAQLPRVPTSAQIELILVEVEKLRIQLINQLKPHINAPIQSGNPHQNERHIQNSDTESISESEPEHEVIETIELASAEVSHPSAASDQCVSLAEQPSVPNARPQLFKLSTVLQACPQITDYAPGGKVQSWRDLIHATNVVALMLGVSASAYQKACAVMGPETATIVLACILEKASTIKSAGGYLRDLTHRATRGEFALAPMLMALLRANTPQRHCTN